MKKNIHLVVFILYWMVSSALFLLPGLLVFILTGEDVWNNYMNNMFKKFLQLFD